MNAITSLLPDFAINPDLDTEELTHSFKHDGYVRISRFLVDGAPEFYRYLENSRDWIQVINHESGAHEIDWNEWRVPNSAVRARHAPEMIERARDGFQYSYSALRIPSADEKGIDTFIDGLAAFINSSATMKLLSSITGIERPTFTDGQVTAYGEGDFLTGHDDDVVGAHRKAAFVLGLTPQWRLEWGGLLMFHELGAVNATGMVPQFNTLDLFAVPKYHSVSMVTPFAPRRRFSVTGWLSSSNSRRSNRRKRG